MKYHNPVISGFYPDPSVCKAGNNFYLVTSSFEYFPGIPIFKSKDLLNWKSIGSVLNRPTQLSLKGSDGHSGIYAPTIRFHDGTFYVVTTNIDHGGHFFVTSKKPEEGWSDPIYIRQEGIDPSLFFDGEKAYFLSTAQDHGKNTILLSKLNIKTGEVSDGQYIWYGNGGRYLEGPHLYKIDGYYYLLASEGGTEYGHMLVVARSKKIFGPYESYADNPILTNRDLGGYQLQGAGHGDLVKDKNNNWWVIFLAFRQLDENTQFHTLGREVNLMPVDFKEGWPTISEGHASLVVETNRELPTQKKLKPILQKQMEVGKDLFFLRNPDLNNYNFSATKYILRPNEYNLTEKVESPTAVFIRQRSFVDELHTEIDLRDAIGGVTAYLEPDLHYDLLVKKLTDTKYVFKVRLQIGPAKSFPEEETIEVHRNELPEVIIKCSNKKYSFVVKTSNELYDLGSYDARFLSSEVAGNFTGVMLGLFTEKEDQKDGEVFFKDLSISR